MPPGASCQVSPSPGGCVCAPLGLRALPLPPGLAAPQALRTHRPGATPKRRGYCLCFVGGETEAESSSAPGCRDTRSKGRLGQQLPRARPQSHRTSPSPRRPLTPRNPQPRPVGRRGPGPAWVPSPCLGRAGLAPCLDAHRRHQAPPGLAVGGVAGKGVSRHAEHTFHPPPSPRQTRRAGALCQLAVGPPPQAPLPCQAARSPTTRALGVRGSVRASPAGRAADAACLPGPVAQPQTQTVSPGAGEGTALSGETGENGSGPFLQTDTRRDSQLPRPHRRPGG